MEQVSIKHSLVNTTAENNDQSSKLYQSLQINRSHSQMLQKSDPFCIYKHIKMQKSLPKWTLSASTLRHTATYNKFSQSHRFLPVKNNYDDSQQINIPSAFGGRSTSFGLGRRASVPDVFLHSKNTATLNCPFYEINQAELALKRSNLSLKEGKTFGLNIKSYQSVRAPHRHSVHSAYQVKANPGPNYYNPNPELANQRTLKIQMHSRLKMFTNLNADYRRNQPHPQTYQINDKLVKNDKAGQGFGYGNKIDFTKLTQKTPGAIYEVSKFGSQFIRSKSKMGRSKRF